MYKKLVALALLCAVSALLPRLAQAVDEDIDFSFGTVQSVNAAANQIIVLEHDYDTEGDVSVTYEINADTDLDDLTSLSEVKAGDAVDIEYCVSAKGKRIAKYLDVTEKNTEEEVFEEEEAQEEPFDVE